MKKNDITYEYRVFTNRLIDVDSMEVGKCTSKVIKDIKPKDKVDGRFFHTSDTDEWYFCWKGELQKLNLKGDSDVSAALDEVKKLIDDANAAVSDVKATAKEAQQAAVEAKAAADAAGEAIETIDSKADKSAVEELAVSVANKADVSVVNTLSQKISEKADKSELDRKADASDVKDLSDKVNAINLTDYATKTDIKGLASESFVTSQGYVKESDIPSFIPSLDEYVTEYELSLKGYLTEHQDLSEYAKQEWVKQQGYLKEHQNLSEYVTETELEGKGYITEEVLNTKGYLTEQSLNGYATETFVDEKIAEKCYTKTEIDDMISDINTLIDDAVTITKTILEE